MPRLLLETKAIYKNALLELNKFWTLKQLLGGGNKWFLQTQFNLVPLFSDMKGIYNAIRKHERRVNDLITRAGRPQRRHWSSLLSKQGGYAYSSERSGPYSMDPLFSEIYPGGTGSRFTWRYVYPVGVKFHVEIEYNFSFTQYQREHARVLSLLDSLGVGGSFNPQIIWNAIPWSFVVDWVINVSKWLGQFTVSAMEPVINIRRALWSMRAERIIVLTKTVGENDMGLPYTKEGHCGTIAEVSFRRQPYLPTHDSIVTSGLNSKEFSLGAALVFARKRLRRRR